MDEAFAQTDIIETHPATGDPTTPLLSAKTPGIKPEITASDSGVQPESTGCYLIRFVKAKEEGPLRGNTKDDEVLGDVDEWLPDILSETDDDQNPSLGQTNVPDAGVSVLSEPTPSLVSMKYALIADGVHSQEDPEGHGGVKQAHDSMTQEAHRSKNRHLERCLSNEHDSARSSALFDGDVDPFNYVDLSRRLFNIQMASDTQETDASQPPRCIALFPPTQIEKSPAHPLTATTTRASAPSIGKNETTQEKKAPPKAKAARQSNVRTVDNPIARQEDPDPSKGVSLGEYKADDIGT